MRGPQCTQSAARLYCAQHTRRSYRPDTAARDRCTLTPLAAPRPTTPPATTGGGPPPKGDVVLAPTRLRSPGRCGEEEPVTPRLRAVNPRLPPPKPFARRRRLRVRAPRSCGGSRRASFLGRRAPRRARGPFRASIAASAGTARGYTKAWTASSGSGRWATRARNSSNSSITLRGGAGVQRVDTFVARLGTLVNSREHKALKKSVLQRASHVKLRNRRVVIEPLELGFRRGKA